MPRRSTVEFTTAPGRTGKSLYRGPMFLIKEFLPDSDGHYWTNIPIYPDKIAQEVARRTGKPAEEFEQRLHVIPEEEMKRWQEGESGPWEFFADKDMSGAHVAIDEIHNFCGRKSPPKIKAKYQAWLGEIGHMGCTTEFISQSPMKVAKEIEYEAAVKREMSAADARRDPYFRIPLGDWYELRAAFLTGQYESVVWVQEAREQGTKWVKQHPTSFRIDPFYFPFYNSFNKPQQTGQAGKAEKKEFEKRTRKGLLWWFVRRHLWALFSRFAVVALIIWITLGGGSRVVFAGLLTAVGAAGPSAQSREKQEAPQLTPEEVRIQELEQEQRRLRNEAEALRQRQRESEAVVLLTPEGVVFREGYSYAIGEEIDYGEFAGLRVVSIDMGKRSVELDDGRMLRMGRPGGWVLDAGEPDTGPGDGFGSDVRGDGRGADRPPGPPRE